MKFANFNLDDVFKQEDADYEGYKAMSPDLRKLRLAEMEFFMMLVETRMIGERKEDLELYKSFKKKRDIMKAYEDRIKRET